MASDVLDRPHEGVRRVRRGSLSGNRTASDFRACRSPSDCSRKVVAPVVTASTAKDGNYETCVRGVVAGGAFPDPHFDGLYPAKVSFHVGRLDHE